MSPRCGTYDGANDHKRAGERTCSDCRDAQAAYMAMWRRRVIFEGTQVLLERRPDLADMAQVGPVVVGIWRSS